MATRAGFSSYRLYVRQGDRTFHAKSEGESVRRAIGIARRATKRRKILDVQTTDISGFCKALAACEERLAAVIVTPDEKDPKHRGFLREVRELTSAEGALLIWREKDDDRAETRGPREILGIQPDITCYSEKIHARS